MISRIEARRKLVKACIIGEDCWLWRRPIVTHPRVRIEGRQLPATHVMWWVTYREWPVTSRTQRIVSQCGNRRCIRPRHLGYVTLKEAMLLYALRTGQVFERQCDACRRWFNVRRSQAAHRRYCSWRCYREVRQSW